MPAMRLKETENDYNVRIGGDRRYYCFHGRPPVRLPANRGPVEFCDLARDEDGHIDLIHVKRYGKSSKLSHLFFQGTNSARLFRTSPEFRKALCDSVEGNDDLAGRLSNEPARQDFRVVFAIASSSSSRLEIPLFSKLSLRQALRELDGLGFGTLVTQVEVPSDERKVKKSKSHRKTF
jgi:uncharacterized protein (TIGR04141 family)